MAVVLIHAYKSVSSTDIECSWSKRKAKEVVKTVDEMYPPTKPEYRATSRPVAAESRCNFRTSLAQLPGGVAFAWLLQTEPDRPYLSVPTLESLLSQKQYKLLADGVGELTKDLALTPIMCQQVEQASRGQATNPLWAAYRRGRITASNFGPVLKSAASSRQPAKSLIKTLHGDYDASGARAVQWGIEHEQVAIDIYGEANECAVSKSGLWLHTSGLFGGSPDGIVDDMKIVEVKCPYSARNTSLATLAAQPKGFFLKQSPESSLILNIDNDVGRKYFHQMQGYLYLTGRSVCDLVVWTPSETAIILVQKDPEWEKNVELICSFAKVHFLPSIVNECCPTH